MSLMKAKWIAKDIQSLEDAGGTLRVKIDATNALERTANGIAVKLAGITNDMLAGSISDDKLAEQYVKADGSRSMTANLDMNNFQITNLAAGTEDHHAVNLAQLNQVITQGKAWKEVIFTNQQLVDGASGGIAAAQVITLSANLEAGDEISVSDGTSTETYIAGTDFTIGATINETLANLATVIDASPLAVASTTSVLDSIDSTNDVLVVWQEVIGSDTRVFGNTTAAAKVSIADPTLSNVYEAEASNLVALPTTDPGSTNFGFYRTLAQLTANETHLSRTNESSYTWDSDAQVWNQSGATSIPYASKTEYGKMKVGDGLEVAAGLVWVQPEANQGIRVSSSGVAVDYDDSSIGIVGGKLAIKSGGITNDMIANSTVGISDGTNSDVVNLGETVTFSGSTGISTQVTDNGVTISGVDATTTTKGVASFSANDFDVNSGVVTIKAGGVTNTQLANSTITMAGDSGVADPVALGETLTVTGDIGITTEITANTITVKGVDASTTSKGVAQFDGSEFTVAAGVVNLKDGGIANSRLANPKFTVSSADDSSSDEVNLGETLTLDGSVGIAVSVGANTVTISGVDASTTSKGVAQFLADDFSVTSGEVSLAGTVVKSVAGDTGSLTPSGHSFTVAGGTGISTTASGQTITIEGVDASTTSKGVAQFDSNNFTVSSGLVSLVADGVDTTHIDWGVGTNQVYAAHMPILDSGNKLTATNVEDALSELADNIDAIQDRRVETFTLTSTDITNGYVTLSAVPDVATDVVLLVKDAPAQFYGVDYTMDGTNQDRLTWSGLGLDGVLAAGDQITVIYTV